MAQSIGNVWAELVPQDVIFYCNQLKKVMGSQTLPAQRAKYSSINYSVGQADAMRYYFFLMNHYEDYYN